MPKKKREFNLRSYIISSLRRAWLKTPQRYEVKKRCQGKRHGWWKCELCGRDCEKLTVDHINPVVSPVEGMVDCWDWFIRKLFVHSEFLQGLCTECHEKKTKGENLIRKEQRKNVQSRRKKYAGKDVVTPC
jgi:5-methylcytosine-specific restriction endonuclease McrA